MLLVVRLVRKTRVCKRRLKVEIAVVTRMDGDSSFQRQGAADLKHDLKHVSFYLIIGPPQGLSHPPQSGEFVSVR